MKEPCVFQIIYCWLFWLVEFCGYLCSKRDKVMSEIEDKYISLLTDFGFKRIFGTDLNKDLLISFLTRCLRVRMSSPMWSISTPSISETFTRSERRFSTCIARPKMARSLSWICKMRFRSSLRTALYSIPLFQSVSRAWRGPTGISTLTMSIR